MKDVDSYSLCLKFSNTVGWHGSDHPQETLHNYADLVKWSLDAGTLKEESSKALLRKSKSNPSKANLVLKKARNLRESIYRVLSAESHSRDPKAKDMELLNQYISEAFTELVIRRNTHQDFSFGWKTNGDSLDQMLWPIAKSATDLLVSDKLSSLKECANEDEGCGWLFIDNSKNHSRRWCSMQDCGNRSKVRAFYKRKKSKSSKPSRQIKNS